MMYQRSKHCRQCGQRMLFTRTIPKVGWLMVCLTLGGWLILRMLLKPAWRCATCGGR